MARDMIITPKRIDYARQKENELYESLLIIATKKQEEIRVVITTTVNNLQEQLLNEAASYQFKGRWQQSFAWYKKIQDLKT